MKGIKLLRDLFLKYLTVDSETQDGRCKDFNQAIFIDPSDKFSYGGGSAGGKKKTTIPAGFSSAIKTAKSPLKPKGVKVTRKPVYKKAALKKLTVDKIPVVYKSKRVS